MTGTKTVEKGGIIDVMGIFGPNLNILGTREPKIYGTDNMADIMKNLQEQTVNFGRQIEMMQSNEEGVILTAIEKASDNTALILFNLAACTHTSAGLRDAIAMFETPKVEVHLSNNDRREASRRMSMTAGVSDGSIVGFGADYFSLGPYAIHRTLLRKDSGREIYQSQEAVSGDF